MNKIYFNDEYSFKSKPFLSSMFVLKNFAHYDLRKFEVISSIQPDKSSVGENYPSCKGHCVNM